jgi:hypothetical protein
MLLNPIFSPLVQSSTSNEQQNFSTNKRRYTDSSNESSSSKSQYISSDVANVFANQIVTNNSKSQISTCNLCGKKFQSNDYLQLHLMNKHQIKTDIQRTTKLSNLIKTSNDSLNNNNNTIKKIKLETNETPPPPTTINVIKASSPINAITSPNPSTVVPGIVDTYFAAKMADRVSCDICHKVNIDTTGARLYRYEFQIDQRKCASHVNSKFGAYLRFHILSLIHSPYFTIYDTNTICDRN